MRLFLLVLFLPFQIFADQNQLEPEIRGLFRKNNIEQKDQYRTLILKKDVDLEVSKNSPWYLGCGRVDYTFTYPSGYFHGVSRPYFDTHGGYEFYDFLKDKKGTCTKIEKTIVHDPDFIRIQLESIVKFYNQSSLYTYLKLTVTTEIKKINDESFSLSQDAKLFCDENVISKKDCEKGYLKRVLNIKASRN